MQDNTLNPLILAAALECAGKNDVRFYLNGVYIRADAAGYATLCGTDGHMMMVIRTAIRWSLPSVVVPRDVVPQLAKLKNDVTFELADGRWRASTARGASLLFSPVDGTYPDVVPLLGDVATEGTHNALGAGLVLRAAKATELLRKALGCKELGMFMPQTRNQTRTVWSLELPEDGPVTAAGFVIMPLRRTDRGPSDHGLGVGW